MFGHKIGVWLSRSVRMDDFIPGISLLKDLKRGPRSRDVGWLADKSVIACLDVVIDSMLQSMDAGSDSFAGD
jgi:hypothetical protein